VAENGCKTNFLKPARNENLIIDSLSSKTGSFLILKYFKQYDNAFQQQRLLNRQNGLFHHQKMYH
jgi:hypothetical protein